MGCHWVSWYVTMCHDGAAAPSLYGVQAHTHASRLLSLSLVASLLVLLSVSVSVCRSFSLSLSFSFSSLCLSPSVSLSLSLSSLSLIPLSFFLTRTYTRLIDRSIDRSSAVADGLSLSLAHTHTHTHTRARARARALSLARSIDRPRSSGIAEGGLRPDHTTTARPLRHHSSDSPCPLLRPSPLPAAFHPPLLRPPPVARRDLHPSLGAWVSIAAPDRRRAAAEVVELWRDGVVRGRRPLLRVGRVRDLARRPMAVTSEWGEGVRS